MNASDRFSTVIVGIVNDSDAFNSSGLFSHRPGFFVEITVLVCRFLNLTCVFTIAPTPANRTIDPWEVFLQDMQNGVYDTTIPLFSPYAELKFNFIYPDFIYSFPMCFVVQRPKMSTLNRFVSFLRPFRLPLWSLVILTVILISFIILIDKNFINISRKSSSFLVDILTLFLWIFTYLTRKGPKIDSNSRPVDLVLLVWGFAAVLLTSAYCGSILSYLIGKDPPLKFTNFHTMVNCVVEQECIITIDPTNSYIITKIFSNSPKYSDTYKLYEAVINGKNIKVDNVTSGLQLIRNSNGKTVFSMIFDYFGNGIVEKDDKQLMVFNGDIYGSVTFPFRANDSLCAKFARKLQTMREMGLIHYLNLKYYGYRYEKVQENRRLQSVIGVMEISGTIVLLLLSYVFGLLMLLCEKGCNQIQVS